MTLPNFLVIGAGRSGTTSLGRHLAQHPDVYLPAVKAPSHFFCADLGRIEDPATRLVTRNYFVPDAAAYEALFDAADDARAIGEVSPVYLASTAVPERIATRLGEVRLIAILRNPVDRVWARYVARRRDGLERREFAQLVTEERREPLVRDVAFHTYLAAGFVCHFLRPYLELFGRERVRIHLYEDFARDPAAVLADLFGFLGVDPAVEVEVGVRHNRSGGEIRNGMIRRAWQGTALARAAVRSYVPLRVRDAVFARVSSDLVPVELDPALRSELTALYREEVDRLSSLIERDLTEWQLATRGK